MRPQFGFVKNNHEICALYALVRKESAADSKNDTIQCYIMKKKYLMPDLREAYVGFDENFLVSNWSTGGVTGEDLDDPNTLDPWS